MLRARFPRWGSGFCFWGLVMANYYFKHLNTASQGATLSTLLANNDYEAYAAFWVLLELVSRFEDRGDAEKRGEITISWNRYGREINMKPTKSRRVLSRIASVSKIEIIEKPDGNVTFRVPNWLKLQETRGEKNTKKNDKKMEEHDPYRDNRNIRKKDSRSRYNSTTTYEKEFVFKEEEVPKEYNNPLITEFFKKNKISSSWFQSAPLAFVHLGPDGTLDGVLNFIHNFDPGYPSNNTVEYRLNNWLSKRKVHREIDEYKIQKGKEQVDATMPQPHWKPKEILEP